MHLWQAIKMASKSLWTNKLRSFLTMLGIIIGVMTVALLTSVASGVQTAVVSQIRTQSTLSIIMGMSDKMTYGSVTNVLKNNQHEKEAEDYYDFSLVHSTNRVVSQDLTGVSQSNFHDEYNSYLDFNKIVPTDEQWSAMSDAEKNLVQLFLAQSKKTKPTSASIYAVDKNFTDVYEVEFSGEFPKNGDELLVDSTFIETYLPENISNENVIGSKISIGVDYFTKITIKFNKVLTVDERTNVVKYIQGSYEVENGDEKVNVGLGLVAHNETVGSGDYSYDEETNTLSFNVDFFTTATNEEMTKKLDGSYTPASVYDPYVLPFFKDWIADDGVSVDDVYDLSNQKVYTITGIISDENVSFMSNMSSGSQGERLTVFDIMTSAMKGTCYTILDDSEDSSNLSSLGFDQGTSKNQVRISYAYLRFKTEDVMDDRINDLNVSFISSGIMFMSDFMVVSMNAVASIVDSVMNTLTIMLTVISIVSLIIGGIGIMNIMLVAVTERTREIGIRKAIGAKRGSILTQFLVEALMLSLLGGAIGLGISAIGCAIIGHFMGISITMPLWVIGMSVGFCTAIGLLFGMFPAIKASHMQPIDALRRE